MREQYLKRGYALVYTPHVMRADLWKTSGHLENYRENMLRGMELDDAEYLPQADELPRPHPDLRRPAAQLSRIAGAPGRIGHRLSL